MSTPEQNERTDELISDLRRTANFAPATTREMLHEASENLATLTAENARLREALVLAQQFIERGIKGGHIELPYNRHDPAHDVQDIIRKTLAPIDAALTPQEGQSDE